MYDRYVIDKTSDEKYFIVYLNGEELFKVAKSCNTLEKIINMLGGNEKVKEVI